MVQRCCGPWVVTVAFASVPIQPVTKCHAVMVPVCTVQGSRGRRWVPVTRDPHMCCIYPDIVCE